MLVEVGRSMSRFLKYIGLTEARGSMWLLARTASRTWARCCSARAYYRCGRQSVQRVVHELDAVLLAQVVDVVACPYSESYVDWMQQC